MTVVFKRLWTRFILLTVMGTVFIIVAVNSEYGLATKLTAQILDYALLLLVRSNREVIFVAESHSR